MPSFRSSTLKLISRPSRSVREFQIGAELREMNRQNSSPRPCISTMIVSSTNRSRRSGSSKHETIILDGLRLLAMNVHAGLVQLMGEAGFINALDQPRTKASMHGAWQQPMILVARSFSRGLGSVSMRGISSATRAQLQLKISAPSASLLLCGEKLQSCGRSLSSPQRSTGAEEARLFTRASRRSSTRTPSSSPFAAPSSRTVTSFPAHLLKSTCTVLPALAVMANGFLLHDLTVHLHPQFPVALIV